VQPQEIIGVVLGSLTILGIILGALMWVIRREVGAISAEFRPNGGNSARDLWARTELEVRDLRHRLDTHIDNHNR
jgi:uncharacterized iron-regulated membrane protein